MLLEIALELVVPALISTVTNDLAEAVAGRIAAAPDRSGQRPEERPAGRPAIRAVPSVMILSSTPGRVRFDVSGLRGRRDLAAALTSTLRHLSGVSDVTTSPVTGRLLVHFDPEQQDLDTLTVVVEQVRAQLVAAESATVGHLRVV